MKSGTIRLVVVLATISVLGIVLTQLFWTRKAFNLEDTRFNISVNNALREVANQIYAINESTDPDHHTGSEHLPLTNVVRQPSDSYFLVMINGVIDTKILETLLKGEFEKRGIRRLGKDP